MYLSTYSTKYYSGDPAAGDRSLLVKAFLSDDRIVSFNMY
jgi:hypothetical protein